MKSLLVFVLISTLLLCSPVAVLADEPPPLPTLVPSGVITDQLYQMQEFERAQAYDIQETTIYTAAVSGATWAIDRRFTYGEAAIVIMLMAVVLVILFDLMYKIAVGAR